MPGYPVHIDDVDLERRVKAIPFLLAVYTASEEQVTVHVEVDPEERAIDEGEWEHIVEAHLDVPSAKLVVATAESYLPDSPRIVVAPGSYRVRIHARGFGGSAQEEYMLSMKLAAAAPIQVVKTAGPYAV